MRISCHLLPIESGRYKKIPRVERLCPLCNRSEIGDEFHYLLKCTHSSLSHTRGIFLESPYSINSNFTNMDNIHQKLQTIRRILGLVVRPRVKIACEQALRGALVARREKEGALAFTSLKFEFHLQFPCGSPSTELSDFRQSGRSGNEHKCKQTLKNTCQG